MTSRQEVDHLDVRRLVVPLWFVVTLILSMIATTASVVGIYFTLVGKIDDMQRNVTTLLSAVDRVAQTADAALTSRDLDNWCLKAQIANTNWRCPIVGADGTVIPPQPQVRIRPAIRSRPIETKAN